MIEFDDEDKEALFELAESLKQKYGIKNITFHFDDISEYWYIQTLER